MWSNTVELQGRDLRIRSSWRWFYFLFLGFGSCGQIANSSSGLDYLWKGFNARIGGYKGYSKVILLIKDGVWIASKRYNTELKDGSLNFLKKIWKEMVRIWSYRQWWPINTVAPSGVVCNHISISYFINKIDVVIILATSPIIFEVNFRCFPQRFKFEKFSLNYPQTKLIIDKK